jgi:hypothetical protein
MGGQTGVCTPDPVWYLPATHHVQLASATRPAPVWYLPGLHHVQLASSVRPDQWSSESCTHDNAQPSKQRKWATQIQHVSSGLHGSIDVATCPLLLVVYFTAAATSIHECDSAPIDLSCRDCVIDCACLSEHNSINPEGSDRVCALGNAPKLW